MLLSEFDYKLPEELIAQTPAEKSENSRMMVLGMSNNTIQHKHFFDIVDLLDENHILILDDEKVIPDIELDIGENKTITIVKSVRFYFYYIFRNINIS